MSTPLLMRYLIQNHLCCCIFTLGANKRRSAPCRQLTDRNVGARGECLERPQKIIKRELVDLLFKYVSRDVRWLCEKSAIPTKSWRFVKNHGWGNSRGTDSYVLSLTFCEISNICVRARRNIHVQHIHIQTHRHCYISDSNLKQRSTQL